MSDSLVRFADLEGVDPQLASLLERRGIITAFPVQAAVVPVAATGRDVLVQSPTGSGKTMAFGLPIIDQLDRNTSVPSAVILVPTRELALQVHDELVPLATGKQLRCAAVFGGSPIYKQAQAVKTAAIIVATPGRLADLIRTRKIDIRAVRILVLDEADRMLDMGFQPQVEEIVEKLPRGKRQTMLFSATLEGRVAKVANELTDDAETVRVDTAPGRGGKIEHVVWQTTGGTKVDTAVEILERKRDLAVAFVRTQRSAETLTERLRSFGIAATAIHGGMSQNERLREYGRFQKAECNVLVATDVFARGMDLDRITLVLNYDMPDDADTYQHRSGRTGRAGRTGTCITMFTSGQKKTLRRMVREAGVDLAIFDDVRYTKKTRREPLPASQHFAPSNARGGQRGGSKFERPQQGGRPQRRDDRHTPHVRTAALSAAQGGCEGTVISYDAAKGFGFIKPDGGGADVFFHRKGVDVATAQDVRPGALVSFSAQTHSQGVRANDVTVVQASDRKPAGKPARSGRPVARTSGSAASGAHSRTGGGSYAPWKQQRSSGGSSSSTRSHAKRG